MFFLYFNIGPNNNKTKINDKKKKKKKKKIFLQTFNLFNTHFIFDLQESQIRRVLKKKIQKELCIYKDLIMTTFPCKSNKGRC